MTIDAIHEFIKQKLNAVQSSYTTPAEIDRALNVAQLEEFREHIEIVSMFKDVRPTGTAQREKLRKAKQYLSPFLVKASVSADSSGLATLPSDVEFLNAARGPEYNIPIILEDQWINVITSDIVAPTADEPAAIQNEPDKLQLFPEAAFDFTINYYRKPIDVAWGFTNSGRNAVYDSGSSTQPEWKERSLVNIIHKALQHLGVQVRSEIVIQDAMISDKPGE